MRSICYTSSMWHVSWSKLTLSLLSSFSAGLIGSVFTFPAIPTWYATLQKPFFSPPNWVFGPVWTVLYILMGIALYSILTSTKGEKTERNLVTRIFYLQLGFNAIWSILFFGLKMPIAAFIEILLLWGSIFILIRLSRTISPASGWLLTPYLLWVSFAAILNFSIILLNP